MAESANVPTLMAKIHTAVRDLGDISGLITKSFPARLREVARQDGGHIEMHLTEEPPSPVPAAPPPADVPPVMDGLERGIPADLEALLD